ncbi:hypothetical protein MKX01_005611 [Papaver californicum]|nr:hypothetical protein MKX01_005611 [Papaver californicum]
MHLSENKGIEGSIFLVTGGLGFVGSSLCSELIRRGAREVRTLDLRSSSPWSADLNKIGVKSIQGDVSKNKDVAKALRGVDCVFHLASYGMSGKEMIQAGVLNEVNINGTCHVLDACFEFGVKRLVYVSTYNVVFGGQEIVNGNEALPYFPMDDHVDPYGCSKSVAEQLVLKSNGRASKKNGTRLYTCVIRPAAIYGPGEERHLPRIISLAKLGLLAYQVGGPTVKSDWVYVDNLVLALILASMGLLDNIPGREGTPVAAGQPYFICDGSPVNTFEFIRPLICPHGESPRGHVCDHLVLAGKKEEIFGWAHHTCVVFLCDWNVCLPVLGPVKPLSLRSMSPLQILFVASVAAHLGEAIYAWYLAKKVDPANAKGWFWQAFALGFFSLHFLLKRAGKE